MRRRVEIFVAVLGFLLSTERVFAQAITVNAGVTHQTIEGFGGFGAAEVWWEPGPWHDAAFIDLIINDMGSTIVRTQIYWDGEVSNDNGDPTTIDWSGFDFGPDSDNGRQFPYIRDLSAAGLDKLIASVWTPPLWMKLDADDSLGVFCEGQCGGRLNPTLREEFAEYLVAYVLRLKAETGVDLYALSIQNEPLFANPFESCVYTPEEYADTLRVVGARFEREGLSTRLFGPEHMGDFEWNAGLLSAVFDDSEVSSHLPFYAVHSYLDGVSPDYGSAQGWTSFDARMPVGKSLWMTEMSDYERTGWDRAFEMAKSVHLALKHGKVSAWVYWVYVDLVQDARSTVLADALKGFFRHVRPGYVMVDATADDSDLLVTAYRSGSNLTIVVINNGEATKTTEIDVAQMTTADGFDVYRTTEADRFVGVGHIQDSVVLPGRSVTTLVAVRSAAGADAGVAVDAPAAPDASVGAVDPPDGGTSSGGLLVGTSDEAVGGGCTCQAVNPLDGSAWSLGLILFGASRIRRFQG